MDSFDISHEISHNESPRPSIAIHLPTQPGFQGLEHASTSQGTPEQRQLVKPRFPAPCFEFQKSLNTGSLDTVEDPPVYTASHSLQHISYKQILLGESNCDLLIDKYMEEICSLRMSDARNEDFTFRNSFNRLMKGYNIVLFSYKTAEPIKAFISADGYGILVKQPFSLEKHFSYQSFSGLLLGDVSSTFKRFTSKNQLNSIGLDHTDCFSLLNKMRSLDFATHSDTAKYDIWQVFLGYQCALSPTLSSSIPLNKYQLTLFKVKSKIKKMAYERYMSIKELFLIAILKTLIITKASNSKIKVVKQILNKSFSPGTKIFRFAITQRPKNFKPSKLFLENISEGNRVIKLSRRMAFMLFETDKERIKLLGDWTVVKASNNIYAISTLKKYLKNYKSYKKTINS